MPREMLCELCGSRFECGAPGICWCSGVRLNKSARDTLSTMSRDCVCRNCLEKAAITL